MGAFFTKNRQHIFLFAACCAWIVAFPIWEQQVTRDPLNTIISTFPQGKVEENISIPIPETYSLHFMFERNGIEVEQLKKTVGSMGCLHAEDCSKGIPIPIRWSLKSIDSGTVVAGEEIETIDSQGWSGAHVYRNVGSVRVQPGNYVFKAEVLRPVPELAYLRTHIALQVNAKSASTWQMLTVWFGSIVQLYFVWPIAIIISISLLWQAGLAVHSNK